jgi:hypothetical protein
MYLHLYRFYHWCKECYVEAVCMSRRSLYKSECVAEWNKQNEYKKALIRSLVCVSIKYTYKIEYIMQLTIAISRCICTPAGCFLVTISVRKQSQREEYCTGRISEHAGDAYRIRVGRILVIIHKDFKERIQCERMQSSKERNYKKYSVIIIFLSNNSVSFYY